MIVKCEPQLSSDLHFKQARSFPQLTRNRTNPSNLRHTSNKILFSNLSDDIQQIINTDGKAF
jgi:hypothetical protein